MIYFPVNVSDGCGPPLAHALLVHRLICRDDGDHGLHHHHSLRWKYTPHHRPKPRVRTALHIWNIHAEFLVSFNECRRSIHAVVDSYDLNTNVN